MPRLYSHRDALEYLHKKPVRNFAGRKGYGIDWIILHYTWGRKHGDLDTLTSRSASSHLYVENNGDIWWLVSFENAAWHAGINPALAPVRAREIRPNERSIGIEIEGFGDFTEEQYRALEFCLPLLLHRYKIPLKLPPNPYRGCDPKAAADRYETEFFDDFRGLLAHGNIHGTKVDPGMNFLWERIACIPPMPDPGPLDAAGQILYRGDLSAIPEGGMEYELKTYDAKTRG